MTSRSDYAGGHDCDASNAASTESCRISCHFPRELLPIPPGAPRFPAASCVTSVQDMTEETPESFQDLRPDDVIHGDDSTATDSQKDEVILSVYWRRGKLGAASYSMETSEVSVVDDIVDVNPEFHVLSSLVRQVQPTKVLTCTNMADVFVATLRQLLGLQEGERAARDLADKSSLVLLPGRDYNYESCKRRVLDVRLPGERVPLAADTEQHTWYINSLLNLSSESMVLALGTLLTCLDRSFVYLNLEVTRKAAPISAMNHIAMDDLVMMDADTYEALQVFSQLSHPSNFKRGLPGSSKEGVSVFSMLNRCHSALGTKYLRVMLLHPSRDVHVLNARLDVVQLVHDGRHEDVVKGLVESLKSITNINRVVNRLLAARASVSEWKSLHRTILNCVTLAELCARIADEALLFRQIADSLTEEMYQVAHCIDSIVDFNEAEKQNKFVVKVGVDEELDRKKQKYGGLPSLMSSLAREELELLPPYVKQCSVVYIPEIGYLVAVPVWKQPFTEGDRHLQGLDFMFKVGDVVHYKSARCRELDTVLGDCVLQIAEHESRIMLRLVHFIELHLHHLHHMIGLFAQLDCLIALGVVARERGFVRPMLSRQRTLAIRSGRHPLQELCVSDFVPNDTLSGEEHGLMTILTGPNASGKSVYLKQVALIAYLAHTGSFVPAAAATIGVLDHIHSRIQTVESVCRHMSAFTIDIRQMALALYCSTPSSLLLIDEFGKGSSEVDGLALLAASLQHLLSRDLLCPHVLVSTHFHSITRLLPPSPLLSLKTMDHVVEEDGHVVYLHQLIAGSTLSSMSIKVAAAVGLSRAVTDRASEVLEAMRTGKPLKRNENSRRPKKMAMERQMCQLFSGSDFSCEDIGHLVGLLGRYRQA